MKQVVRNGYYLYRFSNWLVPAKSIHLAWTRPIHCTDSEWVDLSGGWNGAIYHNGSPIPLDDLLRDFPVKIKSSSEYKLLGRRLKYLAPTEKGDGMSVMVADIPKINILTGMGWVHESPTLISGKHFPISDDGFRQIAKLFSQKGPSEEVTLLSPRLNQEIPGAYFGCRHGKG